MSTEEFAKWLNEVSQALFGATGCPHCAFDKICTEELCNNDDACKKGILLWLQSEAKK